MKSRTNRLTQPWNLSFLIALLGTAMTFGSQRALGAQEPADASARPPGPQTARQNTRPSYPVRIVGKYAVELQVLPGFLYADNEIDIHFHLSDRSRNELGQEPPPVLGAKFTACLTMPAMPAMPSQTPRTHIEGVPGDYSIIAYFPHGGDYRLDMTITPPGAAAFSASFTLAVNDADEAVTGPPQPKPYSLEVTTSPSEPRMGRPADLSFLVRFQYTRETITDFDVVHEKRMHLIIVSKDLRHFAHEHPVLDRTGRFTLRYAFPTGGEYRLFADVAPHRAGSYVLMQPVLVAGASPSSAETLAPSP
jgi:hypothetical protein